MKITKSLLKKIIREELMIEGPAPIDSGGLKRAGDDLKATVGNIGKTLDNAGEDVRTGSITAAGQVTVLMKILQEFEKIFRAYEQQTNSRIDKVEEEELPEITKAIRKLASAIDALSKSTQAPKAGTTPATPATPAATSADKTQDYINQLKSNFELGPRE